MAFVPRLCGCVRLCGSDLAQSSLYVRAPLQVRFTLELDQSRHSRHSSPDPVPDWRVGGRFPGRQSGGLKSRRRALCPDRRVDVGSVAAGLSASAPSSETRETERAAQHVRRSNHAADHRHPALCRGWLARVVCAARVGGFDLCFHRGVLCLDQSGNPCRVPSARGVARIIRLIGRLEIPHHVRGVEVVSLATTDRASSSPRGYVRGAAARPDVHASRRA